MARRLAIVIGVAGVMAAFAPGADAATLFASSTDAFYTAVAGEANNLTIEFDGTNLVFTDVVPITPTAPCVAITATKATCPGATLNTVSVFLDDLADTASAGASLPDQTVPILQGGDGADILTFANAADGVGVGGVGTDVITGGPGDDTFSGGDDADLMSGGAGRDRFADEPGNDVYDGGPNADTFTPARPADGADTYIGGDGDDSMDWSNRVTAASITLDGVANDGAACPGAGCEGDNVMPDVEDFRGTRGDDTFVGSPDPNRITGFDGNDTIDGAGGNDGLIGESADDALIGGDGDDTLAGSAGADTASGGPGSDSFSGEYTDAGADTYSGGDGIDSIGQGVGPLVVTLDDVANDGSTAANLSSPKDNVGSDIENVTGSTLNDLIVGSDAANVLSGLGGDDALLGGAGDDSVIGAAGVDTLDGGAGDDSYDGGGSADTIHSRDGAGDTVDCGAAIDTVLGDALDLIEASCEAASQGVVISGSARAGAKGVELNLTCPAVEASDCTVAASLTAKGKKVAKGKATIPAGATQSLSMKLTGAGSDLVGRPGKLKAVAKVTFADATGAPVTTEQKVTVG